MDALVSSLRELAAKASDPAKYKVVRYDHGGGRVYQEWDGTRDLVADFYDEGNRELWIALRNSLDALLSRIEAADAMEEALRGMAEVHGALFKDGDQDALNHWGEVIDAAAVALAAYSAAKGGA